MNIIKLKHITIITRSQHLYNIFYTFVYLETYMLPQGTVITNQGPEAIDPNHPLIIRPLSRSPNCKWKSVAQDLAKAPPPLLIILMSRI